MMRLLAELIITVAIDTGSGDPALAKARDLYRLSAVDERSCRELQALPASYAKEKDPVLCGYSAAATMVMAKYVFSPFSKLSRFREGKKLLQQTIQANLENVELRFIRYSIQTSAPAFLGYKEEVSEDKACLLNYIRGGTDAGLKAMIRAFLNRKST